MIFKPVQCPSSLRRRAAGYSFPEILTVVAVSGVLTGIAVPSMNGMVQRQRAASLTTIFVGSLHLARNEAIKRNGRVVVCKSPTGAACTNAGGWDQGWIVFHDTNNDARYDAGESVVLHQQGVASGLLRLTGNQPVANYVSYSASGTAKLTSGAFQAGTFTLCPLAANQVEPRKIVLSAAGRARTYTGLASDCG